ncbi:hypothetical protein E2P63_04765 [Candidatus Bathyarchaeota archaeon]|nr:hypothetical protein E2P63_04765 [Candidatus Bathyarchaeota archaeon]
MPKSRLIMRPTPRKERIITYKIKTLLSSVGSSTKTGETGFVGEPGDPGGIVADISSTYHFRACPLGHSLSPYLTVAPHIGHLYTAFLLRTLKFSPRAISVIKVYMTCLLTRHRDGILV